MKLIFGLCYLSMLFFSNLAAADLTDKDLRQIEGIVRQIIKEEITASEARVKAEIAASEVRTDLKFQTTNTKIDELDKRLSNIFALVLALIALIAAAIAVPQIIIAFKEKGSKKLEEEVVQLRRELNALKESRLLKP